MWTSKGCLACLAKYLKHMLLDDVAFGRIWAVWEIFLQGVAAHCLQFSTARIFTQPVETNVYQPEIHLVAILDPGRCILDPTS